jgi:hypothetical protein
MRQVKQVIIVVIAFFSEAKRISVPEGEDDFSDRWMVGEFSVIISGCSVMDPPWFILSKNHSGSGSSSVAGFNTVYSTS